MRTYSSISVLAFCSIMAACSGSQFKTGSTSTGDSPSSPEAITQETIDATADEAPGAVMEEPGAPTTPPSTPLVSAEDKTALSECLKQWGSSPFTAQEIAQPKVINIDANVNNNALIYSDDKVTEKPALFLVNFNISVGNNGQLAFLNPKGWYCFNVKAKVINNFIINTACDTHVAIVSKQAQNDKNFAITRQEPCPAP